MKHTPGPWKVSNSRRQVGKRAPNGSLNLLADTTNSCFYDEDKANALLITSAPDLLREHKDWSKILGRIIVGALQKDYEYLGIVANHAIIEYRDGEPFLKSEAISKAEGDRVKNKER